jgi:hypothetical protein
MFDVGYFPPNTPPAGKDGRGRTTGRLNRFIPGTREGAALVRGLLAIKEKPIHKTLVEFIATLKTN